MIKTFCDHFVSQKICVILYLPNPLPSYISYWRKKIINKEKTLHLHIHQLKQQIKFEVTSHKSMYSFKSEWIYQCESFLLSIIGRTVSGDKWQEPMGWEFGAGLTLLVSGGGEGQGPGVSDGDNELGDL